MFGTDGIRAKVGRDPLTPESILRLGRAIGDLLWRGALPFLNSGQSSQRVLIGRDTRASGPLFEKAIAVGLESQGVSVVRAGVLPTPAVSTLVAEGDYDLGIVISASHNPQEYNGIKFFDSAGGKLCSLSERAIAERFEQSLPAMNPQLGESLELAEAADQYLHLLFEDPNLGIDFSDFRIVLDCAHGAVAGLSLGQLCFNHQMDATLIGCDPDGQNINQGFGATDPAAMAQKVTDLQADLGFSFDGDGDRVIVADETGRLVDGDVCLAILATDLANRGQLPVPIVVGTVMSNLGLEQCLAQNGIELLRTPVGDRHVVAQMAEVGAVLGGEPSGHIVFGDRSAPLTGDGLYTALRILAVVARTGCSLGQLASICPQLPQRQIAVAVDSKPPLEDQVSLQTALREAEEDLGREGRILVRYSGTEDVARVMVEGVDLAKVESWAQQLAQAIESDLGAPSRQEV